MALLDVTAAEARRIGAAVRIAEQLAGAAQPAGRARGSFPPLTFLARITAWQALAPNRWKYAWSEVRLDGDAIVDVPAAAGGRSGTLDGNYALSAVELNNSAAGTQGDGVDTSGASYPAGFRVQPIGGGRTAAGGALANQVIVGMTLVVDAAGNWRPIILNFPNAHDGACT